MESSIKTQKTTKGLKKNHKRVHEFVYNLILYSLTSCITCLFFSYPLWYPSMKQLVFSLPNNISLFFNAKCFFILGNIIILILVGESKITQSSRSSPASEIYDEYVARSRRSYVTNYIPAKVKENHDKGLIKQRLSNVGDRNIIQEMNTHHQEEKKKKELSVSKSMHNLHHEEKKKGMRTCKSAVWGESETVKRKTNKERKEVQLCIPTHEELNKRVEAFIARVNKQRLLESKSLDLLSRG